MLASLDTLVMKDLPELEALYTYAVRRRPFTGQTGAETPLIVS
jgi:hypothetical protein